MCGSDDACTLWFETQVIGRKEHRCDECFKPIERGTRHIHIKSLYDGNWSTNRLCLRCYRAWHKHIAHMHNVHGESCLLTVGGLSECKDYHTPADCRSMVLEVERMAAARMRSRVDYTLMTTRNPE